MQREMPLIESALEASYWEAIENYLGVAPIRSGDSVTIRKRFFELL